jgi:hypothetical protein
VTRLSRIVAVTGGAIVLTSVAGAVAAAVNKRRLVRVDDPYADEVALAAVFEPLFFQSTASGFRGGTVDCWYGGGIVDLRAATIDPGGARLRVRAVFGGAQIVVPEQWMVTTRVVGIGGAGDARPAGDRDANAPQLAVEGTAIFGGFGITSSLSDEQVEQMQRAVERYAERRQRRSGVQVTT